MSRARKGLKQKPKKKKKATAKKAKAVVSTWRQFERMVTRIEHVLAPQGAIVKSPDFLIDKTTGEKREVDASIKFKAGTADIIITIECRERSSIQDSMWIEQLVTKQSNIGASKTIAVSSKGFSKPAIKKAKLYGIEIRSLSNIDDNSILGMTRLVRTQYNYRIVNYSLRVDIKEELKAQLLEGLAKLGGRLFDSDFCVSYKNNKRLTLRNILEIFQEKAREKMGPVEIPETGETGVYKIDIKLPNQEIFLESSIGKFDLVGMKVDYTLFKKDETSFNATSMYTYSSDEKSLIKGVEFKIISSKGEPEVFVLHEDLVEGKTKASLWKDETK